MNRHQTSDATSRGSGIRARRLLVLAVAAVPSVSGTLALTAPVPMARAAVNTVAHNRAAGRATAMRRLAHAPLPPGAIPVRTDPEVVSRFQWLHTAVTDTPSGPNVVDLHRFFRVPGPPAAAFRWLIRHRPRGFTLGARGDAVEHGRTLERSVSFVSAGPGDEITQQGVGFEATDARGGGTALRVEGWAVWFVPRPAFETVPDDVFAVAISLDGSGNRQFPVNTVTDPGSVRALADFVDSLQVVQPENALGCAPASSPRIDLRFLFAVGAAPVARAVGDGCVALNFSVLGRRGTQMEAGSADLGDLLWKLHAVPVCAAGQLNASAVPPDTSSLVEPARGMLLHLTNVSESVCGLEGIPRIQLRDANGRPLPIRTPNIALAADAAILAPNASATVELVWGPTEGCHDSSAASIDITPPGLASALTIAVGSRNPPVDPCNRLIYVSPAEPFATFMG